MCIRENYLFPQEAHGPLLVMATIYPEVSVTILILNVQLIFLIKAFISVRLQVLNFGQKCGLSSRGPEEPVCLDPRGQGRAHSPYELMNELLTPASNSKHCGTVHKCKLSRNSTYNNFDSFI